MNLREMLDEISCSVNILIEIVKSESKEYSDEDNKDDIFRKCLCNIAFDMGMNMDSYLKSIRLLMSDLEIDKQHSGINMMDVSHLARKQSEYQIMIGKLLNDKSLQKDYLKDYQNVVDSFKRDSIKQHPIKDTSTGENKRYNYFNLFKENNFYEMVDSSILPKDIKTKILNDYRVLTNDSHYELFNKDAFNFIVEEKQNISEMKIYLYAFNQGITAVIFLLFNTSLAEKNIKLANKIKMISLSGSNYRKNFEDRIFSKIYKEKDNSKEDFLMRSIIISLNPIGDYTNTLKKKYLSNISEQLSRTYIIMKSAISEKNYHLYMSHIRVTLEKIATLHYINESNEDRMKIYANYLDCRKVTVINKIDKSIYGGDVQKFEEKALQSSPFNTRKEVLQVKEDAFKRLKESLPNEKISSLESIPTYIWARDLVGVEKGSIGNKKYIMTALEKILKDNIEELNMIYTESSIFLHPSPYNSMIIEKDLEEYIKQIDNILEKLIEGVIPKYNEIPKMEESK